MSPLNADIHDIRLYLRTIEELMPAALGYQWSVPLAPPEPDPEDGRRTSMSDPTSRVALNPARLELRQVVQDVQGDIAAEVAVLAALVRRLEVALTPYGGA